LNQLDRHATPLIARQSSEWMPTLNDTAWMPTSTSAADQQPGSGSAIAPGAAPLPLMRSIAANTFLPTETASIAMREAVWAQNDSPRHTELTYGPTIGALIRRLTSSTEGSALDEPVFEATEDQAEPRAAYSELALARPVAAEVQRAFSSLQRASATEPAAPASAQASAGKTNAAQPPSIEQISQQVYDYLRRRLAIDRERLNGGF
jgi:hypothetical protein